MVFRFFTFKIGNYNFISDILRAVIILYRSRIENLLKEKIVDSMYFTGLSPVLLVGHIGVDQPLLEEMNMYANKFYVRLLST